MKSVGQVAEHSGLGSSCVSESVLDGTRFACKSGRRGSTEGSLQTLSGTWHGSYGTDLPEPMDCFPMNESLHVELNERQRDLLLRGLRFVRSSRMLEFRETSESSEEKEERGDELVQIRQLCELLDRKLHKGEPAAV